MNELSPIVLVNIYLVIGIIVTIFSYDMLVKGIKSEIENKAFIFCSMTTNDMYKFIKYTPLITIIMWPLFIIAFVEGIFKVINK